MGWLDFLFAKPRRQTGGAPLAEVVRPAGPSPRTPRPMFSDEYLESEVVGESHYQDALWRIVGEAPQSRDNVEWEGMATLLPDPKNRYDRNAVKVVIDGQTVGHISREHAALLQPALVKFKRKRGAEITVACHAKGGFLRKDGTRANVGIVLCCDLDDVIEAAR